MEFRSKTNSGGVTSDLLEDARRRLFWAGLIYAAAFTFAYVIPRYSGLFAAYQFNRTIPDTIAFVSIALGIGLALITRTSWVSTARIADLAMAFEVAGAIGIATNEMYGFFAAHAETGLKAELWGISWVCVWIVSFPILVPASRAKVIVAGLLSAACVPVIVWVTYQPSNNSSFATSRSW